MENLQDYENRTFMIFEVSELDQIDFTTVCETSADTVRKSVDGTKTFVNNLFTGFAEQGLLDNPEEGFLRLHLQE